MVISRLLVRNWRNFRYLACPLRDRLFVVGANASGKSNLLDVFRFLRDLSAVGGGGLQKAVQDRGGLPKLPCLAARRGYVL
ncbi:MAG: AAA family ATPase, partial [Candidatus Latescibacterota bacterium]